MFFTSEELRVIFADIAKKCGLKEDEKCLVENMWDYARFGDGTRDMYYCGAFECGSQELSDKIYHEVCQYI